MLFLLLLCMMILTGRAQEQQQQQKQPIVRHFGNCQTANFGQGRCVYRDDCEFYNVDALDAPSRRQCYSLQRPELICCPRQRDALPLLVARIDNKTLPFVPPPPPRTPDELPQHPHCGTAFAFRVYGGNVTGLLEFPWTTLLEYTPKKDGPKQYICGATFIAQRWLLTAAHCVHERFVGADRRLTGARLGEWNQTTDPDCVTRWNGKQECAPPHIQVDIDRQLMHPQFELNNLTHDIALLRLERPVEWQQLQHVEPVCLPTKRGAAADQLTGSAVDVSGWGLTEHNDQLSDVKRKAMLHVITQQQCQQMFLEHGYTIGPGQLCATGGLNVDSCSGDSGGPLTVEAYTPQRDRFVYLAGIVSYGKEKCGRTDFPGVYTRVSNYMDWIEQTIRENGDVPNGSRS